MSLGFLGFPLDWVWYSTGIKEDKYVPEWRPITAGRQAMDIGESFVLWLEEAGLISAFSSIHLYSHSAGSWLIDGLSRKYQEKALEPDGPVRNYPWIHNTYFDAFNPRPYEIASDDSVIIESLGLLDRVMEGLFGEPVTRIDRWGMSKPELGSAASYAEQFVDRRLVAFYPGGLNPVYIPAVPLTDERLENIATYDVTGLAPDTVPLHKFQYANPFPSLPIVNILNSTGGTYSVPLYVHKDWYTLLDLTNTEIAGRLESHAWPAKWYRQTIPRAASVANPADPASLGFRTAPEFAGASVQVPQARGTLPGQRGSFVSLYPPAKAADMGSPATQKANEALRRRLALSTGMTAVTVDYGDGSGPRELTPTASDEVDLDHAYARAGSYVVTLTQQFLDGSVLTSNLAVTVTVKATSSWTFREIRSVSARGKTAAIELSFSGPIDPQTARLLRSYTLVQAGRDGRLGTRDDRKLMLRKATYNAAGNTVRLALRTPVASRVPLRVRIDAGGMRDAQGLPLDPDGDGKPGGVWTIDHGARRG